jgi:hypothetical protein
MHLSEGCNKWMFCPRKCSQATHGMDDTILGEFGSTYSCPFNYSAKEVGPSCTRKGLWQPSSSQDQDNFPRSFWFEEVVQVSRVLGPRWLSKYIFQSKILDLFLTIASHFYILKMWDINESLKFDHWRNIFCKNPEIGAAINLLLMFDALTSFPPTMWPIFIKSLD